MRIWLYYAIWRVFRRPSVWLIDHDGEQNLRLVRKMPGSGAWYAWRHSAGVRMVYLLKDGAIGAPVSYVRRWELADWCALRPVSTDTTAAREGV